MYDILETDLSFEYLNKIAKIKDAIIIGGWAIYFHVNENYKRAFGIDYLKSRDIDVYVNSKNLNNFIEEIKKLGFIPSSYFFRYELIYSRSKNKILIEKEAKKQPIYDLIYIFLDLFTDKKSKIAWSMNFGSSKNFKMEDMNIIDINSLLELKSISFFEREKLDKEFKDACDIYALSIYSEEKFKITKNIKNSMKKIINRNDLSEFIAENVLKDVTKTNIVIFSLKKILKI